MKKRVSLYRENPDRCIYLNAEITQDLVDALTPQIIKLRANSSDPITVYIDSPGGSVVHATLLINLLKTPSQDGVRCPLITVVTGVAASSAAGILTSGDYAIAYSHATIHYHGVRTNASMLPAITHERASTLAQILRRGNENFALKLAHRSLPRFVLVYTQLRNSFPAMLKEEPELPLIGCLARAMTKELGYDIRLPELAHEKLQRLERIREYYIHRLTKRKKGFRREAEKEAYLIRCLLDWELQENRDSTWRFSYTGLREIQDDFALLNDYEEGQHMQSLEEHIDEWGMFLLAPNQRDEYSNLEKPDIRRDFVRKETAGKFKTLWHFLMILCRSLQEGENPLSAHQAYWLGLIDEVPGSELANLREVMENAEQREKASKQRPLSIAASAKSGRKTRKRVPA